MQNGGKTARAVPTDNRQLKPAIRAVTCSAIDLRNKAVFLDRDGVLNRSLVKGGKPYAPLNRQEFSLLDNVKQACQLLTENGFLLVGVTNQPEIARGHIDWRTINEMHDFLIAELGLVEVRVCPHDDCDKCACRKPRPGMILDAAALYEVDLSSSFMVGDRWKDIDAGVSAGCRTVFVDHGYDEPRPACPDFTCADLFQATAWILALKS